MRASVTHRTSSGLTVDLLSGKVEISNTPSAARSQAAMQGGSIINPRQQEFSLGVILIFALLGGMISESNALCFPGPLDKSSELYHDTSNRHQADDRMAWPIPQVWSQVLLAIAFVMLAAYERPAKPLGGAFNFSHLCLSSYLIYLFLLWDWLFLVI